VTVIELRAITALRSVKMPHQSKHPRLVAGLVSRMESVPSAPLPLEKSADLWFLVWRYRRQITDAEVIAHADEMVNGALHLAL
jgi:hypothetical protein